MTSWRDDATRQCQDDLDGLLSVTVPFAQQMLDKAGEFYPFGTAVTVDGQTQMVAADPEQGEHPASGDVRALLGRGFEYQGLRAAAASTTVWA